MKKRLLLASLIFLNITNGFTQGYIETQKVVAPELGTAYNFGFAVAIQGDCAIVGARNTSEEGQGQAGSVYVLKKNSDGIWVEHQKLVAPDGVEGSQFGNSVEIDGDYVIIGSSSHGLDLSGENEVQAAGAVYIFKKDSNDNWNYHQKIIASERTVFAFFGHSVAKSDNYIVVGANRDGYDVNGENFLNSAGAAYIFEKDSDDVWGEVAKITAPVRSTQDRFGSAVSINGDYIAVGSYQEDEDENETNTVFNAGAVYIFNQDTDNIWDLKQKLVATPRPTSSEGLGWSLDMDDNYIVAGAYISDDVDSGSGAAYVFKLDNNNWSQVDRLTAFDASGQDFYGYDVAINGNRILVGSESDSFETDDVENLHGSLYYYLKNTGEDTFSFQQKVLASNWQDPDDHNYGAAIDLDGDNALVGDWMSDEIDPETQQNRSEAGAVFMLEFDENIVLSNTDLATANPIRVYPNPVKNRLNINLGAYHDVVNIQVTTILGQQVISKVFKNTDSIQLDFQEQPAGIYLVKVTLENNASKVLKIIK